jgi:hypothetical protein
MINYSVARELLLANQYFQGLSDADIDYILLMKVKNAIRQKRLQAFRHRKLGAMAGTKKNDLRRWSKM